MSRIQRTASLAGALTLALCLIAATAFADDWPMWRGPRGDGSSTETRIPTTWSATDGIAWKVAIPGEGHASPIVLGDRIFVVTCDLKTTERLLLCLDRKSGVTLWRKTVFRAPLEARHRLSSCASSTPATDGEYVYVSFLEPDGSVVPAEVVRRRSGKLRADNSGRPVNPGKMLIAAYDLDGKRRWLVRPGDFASVWGYSSCPVVFENTVILNGDHDGEAYIVALQRKTGDVAWKVPRENRIRSHCTPLIRVIEGAPHMFVTGSHSIVSYDPRDGSKHWFTRGPRGRAVASPVMAKGLLLVSTAYPDRELLAIRPDGRGDVTATHVAWRSRQSAPYVPSPIAVGEYFLVVSDQGIASCFDVASGTRHWRERIGKGHSASPVTANGLVYFVSDAGVARVIRPQKKFELVAENALKERCYASPAVSQGRIFLRGERHLYCIAGSR